MMYFRVLNTVRGYIKFCLWYRNVKIT